MWSPFRRARKTEGSASVPEDSLIFRVRDPERADAHLTALTQDPAPVRPFEFLMHHDPSWGYAEQYLALSRLAS